MVNRGEYNERMVYKIEAPETRKMKKQVLGLALRFGVLAGATGGGVGVLMDAGIPMIAFVSLLAAAVCIGCQGDGRAGELVRDGDGCRAHDREAEGGVNHVYDLATDKEGGAEEQSAYHCAGEWPVLFSAVGIAQSGAGTGVVRFLLG